MVNCLGSDIMVPANAEIIIEGEIQPGELDAEGPFGENIGFMMVEGQKAVARITAVTRRNDAIYYGITSQMPPSESTVLQSTANAALTFKRLRQDLGATAVHDLYVDLTFGGQMAHAIVSMTPVHPGHGMKIGRMVAEISSFKRITVVDEDINIRDPVHMDWVLNTRFDPAVDTVIVENVFMRGALDPSVPRINGVKMGRKLVIDATRRYDEAEYSMPPRATMMKALDSWNEEGLPEFTIPKRAQLRIDKS